MSWFLSLIERMSGHPARVTSMLVCALAMSACLCCLIEDCARSELDRVGRRETTRHTTDRGMLHGNPPGIRL